MWGEWSLLNFDYTTKYSMHKPEFFLKNETHKTAGKFDIQTDHILPGRIPDLLTIYKNKRTCREVDCTVLVITG